MYTGKLHWFYYPARALMRAFFTHCTRFQINGLENIPKDGPLIIVVNHASIGDPPLVGAMIPRVTLFMAKEQLFHYPVLGWIVKGFGGFPVRRETIDLNAIKLSIKVLKDNGALVIFPEGHRSKTGQLGEAYDGTGLLASRHMTPILPVGIAGTRNVVKALAFMRPKITVTVGKVFTAPHDQLSRDEVTEFTQEIMRRIAELLPPEQQGRYRQ